LADYHTHPIYNYGDWADSNTASKNDYPNYIIGPTEIHISISTLNHVPPKFPSQSLHSKKVALTPDGLKGNF